MKDMSNRSEVSAVPMSCYQQTPSRFGPGKPPRKGGSGDYISQNATHYAYYRRAARRPHLTLPSRGSVLGKQTSKVSRLLDVLPKTLNWIWLYVAAEKWRTRKADP